MKTYKIVFMNQSVINAIPNSQTIFGAICTILLQTQGKDAFDSYIHSFESEPYFIHSTMYLNHLYPMVKKSIFSLDDVNEMIRKTEDKKNILKALESSKAYKRIAYMSEGIFDKYVVKNAMDDLKAQVLNHPEKFALENGILCLPEESLSMNRNTGILTRNGFSENGTDKTLFYSPIQYYPKDTEFCIYVKTNKDLEYLKSIFKYFEYLGIGNRRSVGMNSFRFERMEEMKFPKSEKRNLLLSRYIPKDDEIDYEQSYYQLDSQVYRSAKEYAGGMVNGKYVHFLEGSWLSVKTKKDFYGRIIETEANGKTVYHYAIGFLV